MSARIQRENNVQAGLALTASASTSAKIAYRTMAGGILFVTELSGASATVSWYVASDDQTTPVALCDAAGNAVTTPVVAGKGYEFPGSAYGAAVVVPVLSTGTGKATVNLKA